MSGITLRVFLGLGVLALALAFLAAVLLVTSQGPSPVSQDLIVYGSR
ncbi:MAG TPA: hypothetical protein VEP73_01435 [Actinomycetota bacterium]|nr:hypothetical protein [Actinomycetota bacterium]